MQIVGSMHGASVFTAGLTEEAIDGQWSATWGGDGSQAPVHPGAPVAEGQSSLEGFLASVERRALRIAEIAVGSRDDALDIVQDAMLILATKYSRKPEGQWPPLFYRILRNRIRDCYRRRRVRSILLMKPSSSRDPGNVADTLHFLPADPGRADPSRAAAARLSYAALCDALGRLPRRQQEAFLFRLWEEMSVTETAAAMSCSEGSVKTHLSRAVRTLRRQLEDHWS